MRTSDRKLIVGRRNALKMIGLGSVGMLAGGFTDILAVEPADMKHAAETAGYKRKQQCFLHYRYQQTADAL